MNSPLEHYDKLLIDHLLVTHLDTFVHMIFPIHVTGIFFEGDTNVRVLNSSRNIIKFSILIHVI